MKTTELMLGDLVLVLGELGKVIEIHEHSVLLQGRNFYFGEEDIELIPLTEEILHKNGFKNDVIEQKFIIAEGASNFSVILISEDNRITIDNIAEYFNSFNKWRIHIDTEDMRTLCTAEITYVHELQHLLKLCKIEKEIVL